MSSTLRRRGLCRVDVIAAVVLLLAGAGTAVPAVYHAGAKQDRTTATNNLKELAIACHNFEASFKRFPQIATEIGGTQRSLHFQLLPYIEQEQVWKASDLAASIPLMRDPADRSMPAGGVYKRTFGTTSFAGNW